MSVCHLEWHRPPPFSLPRHQASLAPQTCLALFFILHTGLLNSVRGPVLTPAHHWVVLSSLNCLHSPLYLSCSWRAITGCHNSGANVSDRCPPKVGSLPHSVFFKTRFSKYLVSRGAGTQKCPGVISLPAVSSNRESAIKSRYRGGWHNLLSFLVP